MSNTMYRIRVRCNYCTPQFETVKLNGRTKSDSRREEVQFNCKFCKKRRKRRNYEGAGGRANIEYELQTRDDTTEFVLRVPSKSQQTVVEVHSGSGVTRVEKGDTFREEVPSDFSVQNSVVIENTDLYAEHKVEEYI